MPTLEDVKTALSKSEDTKGYYEAVSNAILQERNIGKAKVEEIKSKHDGLLGAVKKLGYDPDTSNSDDFVSEIKNQIDAGKQAGKKLTVEQQTLQGLQKDMDKLKSTAIKDRERAEKAERITADKTISEVLTKRLQDKIYGANAHIRNIIREGKAVLGEDKETIFWNNGNGQEDLDKGLQGFLEANKSDLKNSQIPGGNTQPSDNVSSDKKMNRSSFQNMNPTERLEFHKSGGVVTD